ncbi:MAG: efflux RND transporter periplasmic adaptor subunit [Acidobacteria bacterium]|nr:efflux RND transporter periplasmic adaptor subunit [Acidobacteriota bacterium]
MSFVRLAGALLLCAAASGCPSKKAMPVMPPLDVPVVEVVQQDVPIHRTWVGQALGASDVAVVARATGYIVEQHFVEGTRVKKGQLLYTISAPEAQEKLAAAQAQVAAAQVALTKAENDVVRYTPLVEMRALPKRDLDNAISARDSAIEQLDAVRAQQRTAEINLGYTKVFAPIEGLIGISRVEVGAYVGPAAMNTQLNTISTLDPIKIRFAITEREYLELARRLTAGRTAPIPLELIFSDGTVHPHPGKADITDRQIDPVSGTLAVQALFPNPDSLVRPGQFARVRAAVETRTGALVVPQRAVSELQGQFRVFTVDADNKVQLKPVVTGPRVGDLCIIEQGLAVGERVILEGTQKVRPDMTVVPVGAKPGTEPPAVAVPAGA